ncbi:MAG: hypothetical protein AAFQ39_12315 [Pseudomonadota bacterium]
MTDRLRIASERYATTTYASLPEPAQIELRYGARARITPEDAQPLDAIAALDAPALSRILEGEGFRAAGKEPDTDRWVQVRCLSFRRQDEICEIQVESGDARYTFALRFSNLAQWSIAAEEVTALFDSFRVPN